MNWMSTKGEQFLDKHTGIGDSIGHVKTLQEDFGNFENKAKVFISNVCDMFCIFTLKEVFFCTHVRSYTTFCTWLSEFPFYFLTH